MSRASKRAAAALCAIGASVVWVIVETIGGGLLRQHPPMQVVWLRYAAHLAILVPASMLLWGPRVFATRRPVLQLFRGALMFGMPVTFVWASRSLGAGTTWGVFWALPLLVLLAARPLLGERAGRAQWLAVVAGSSAALVIFAPQLTSGTATLAALMSSGTFAGYILVSRKLTDESLPASVFYTALGSMTLVSALAIRAWTPVAWNELGAIAALGAFSIVFLALLDRALELAEAVFVAPLLYAVLLWETLLLVRLGIKTTGPTELLGMGLAIAACVAVVIARRGADERRTVGATSDAAVTAAHGGVS